MDFIILGVGVGLWMYSFVNYRYNEQPWISNSLLLILGLIAVIAGLVLHF